jgi:hypothetical protein
MYSFFTRRWFLILLSSLAALMLLLGGWWLRSWWLEREFAATVAMIEAKGGRVRIDRVPPDWAARLSSWLGNDNLSKLGPPYICVFMDRTHVTRDDLSRIARHTNARYLSLNDATGVDDQALEAIAELTTLETLSLNRTEVTDRGLHALERMHGLSYLQLKDTAITDEGVAYLCDLAAGRSEYQQRRFWIINVVGTKAQAVVGDDIRVKWIHQSSEGQIGQPITVTGRFRTQGHVLDDYCVGVSLRLDGAGSGLELAPVKAATVGVDPSTSEYRFKRQLRTLGYPPGPYRGYAWLQVNHPSNAMVIYSLGGVEVVLRPTE